MAYAWHPWAGRLVCVHETIERPTGAQARCSPTDADGARLREIPVWMLDAAVCCSMWTASEPVAAPSALAALRSLLLEATGGAAAVASPAHHCGDRHATPPSPATDAGAPTRPIPAEPLGHVGRGSRMGGLAGPDTAGADRVAGPPVRGAPPPRPPRRGGGGGLGGVKRPRGGGPGCGGPRGGARRGGAGVCE